MPTIIIWLLGKHRILTIDLLGVPGYIFFRIYQKRDELTKKDTLYNYGFWINSLKEKQYFWEFLLFIKKFLLIFIYKIITNISSIYKVKYSVKKS